MNNRRLLIAAGAGCGVVILLLVLVVASLVTMPYWLPRVAGGMRAETRAVSVPTPAMLAPTPVPEVAPIPQRVVPTLTIPPPAEPPRPSEQGTALVDLTELYRQVNPGVVNIRVNVERLGRIGQGAGSGFVLDKEGHIVTNNHVVAYARAVTVAFYDGTEERAEIVGTDDDSDLAVIKVKELPPDVHPLPLGDSDQVQAGEWVVAIGSPFGLGSSMTLGIVSATGRVIPSGATPFAIPQAIQTDAAINPGNSGGPLLNLQGQIIGVNAQIATGGTPANAGVGFAIPSNIVRRVVPVLIRHGVYQWPWLGVTGGSVNLLIMEANELGSQQGAYIDGVVPDGPADKAGLRGSSGTVRIDGVSVPVGGDVIAAVDGKPVANFDELLLETAMRKPGDEMQLTVIREGRRLEITVTLAARPADLTR